MFQSCHAVAFSSFSLAKFWHRLHVCSHFRCTRPCQVSAGALIVLQFYCHIPHDALFSLTQHTHLSFTFFIACLCGTAVNLLSHCIFVSFSCVATAPVRPRNCLYDNLFRKLRVAVNLRSQSAFVIQRLVVLAEIRKKRCGKGWHARIPAVH